MKFQILNNPDVSHYSIANHVEFNKTTLEILTKYSEVYDAPELLNIYKNKVNQEDRIFKWMRGNKFTEKKAETDHARDKTFCGILELVRGNLKHFDPTISDYAKDVNMLLSNYGNVPHADYNAETASIDSIVTSMNSPEYMPASQAMGLEPWVNELKKQNDDFKYYAAEAEKYTGSKPDVSPKAARRETDEALWAITDRITALANVNGTADFEDLALEFNIHVDVYNTLVNEHYGRLHVKTDITGADITDVEPQTYTGKPVYVIPEVRVRKEDKDGVVTIVELEFQKDFTVAYGNNVEPGTATLTVTGIGSYTGEIDTTFRIIE
jgi:hypothetical protein